MAFGKRAGGDPRPPVQPKMDVVEEGAPLIRARVTNPGGMDHKFIALAAGIVVLSAGAAIAAPSLMSVFSSGIRPIKEVVAGLDVQQVRTALAVEAFPDEDGKAFMTSLATHYPKSHGKLLDALADQAMAGAERDELYVTLNLWTTNFAVDVLPATARTGAEGFDTAVALFNEGLQLVEAEAGGCTGKKLQAMISPESIQKLTRYDGKAYHFIMRANRDFVELAAKGRNAPKIDTRLTANDTTALQSTFFSLVSDPQVSNLMTSAMNSSMDQLAMQDHVMESLNICQLGRAVAIKLEKLPAGTKARLWGTIMSSDPTKYLGTQALSSPFGGGMPDFTSSALSFRP